MFTVEEYKIHAKWHWYSTRHKIGHWDTLPNQSFGLVLQKLNPTPQKETLTNTNRPLSICVNVDYSCHGVNMSKPESTEKPSVQPTWRKCTCIMQGLRDQTSDIDGSLAVLTCASMLRYSHPLSNASTHNKRWGMPMFADSPQHRLPQQQPLHDCEKQVWLTIPTKYVYLSRKFEYWSSTFWDNRVSKVTV